MLSGSAVVCISVLHGRFTSLAYVYMLWGSLNKECGRLQLMSVQGVQNPLRVPRLGALGWPEIGPNMELG